KCAPPLEPPVRAGEEPSAESGRVHGPCAEKFIGEGVRAPSVIGMSCLDLELARLDGAPSLLGRGRLSGGPGLAPTAALGPLFLARRSLGLGLLGLLRPGRLLALAGPRRFHRLPSLALRVLLLDRLHELEI